MLSLSAMLLPQAPLTLAQLDAADNAYSEGQWQDATIRYSELITHNPERAELWSRYGNSLYQEGRYKQAVDACSRAAALGFFPGTQHVRIARCYARIGDADKAIGALRLALADKVSAAGGLANEQVFACLRSNPRFRSMLGMPMNAVMNVSAWKADIAYYKSEMERLHANLYRKVTKDKWAAEFVRLNRSPGSLSGSEITVRLMQIAASIGDGHTQLLPNGFHRYPLRLAWFPGGVRVVAAAEQYKDLLGCKVVRVGNRAVDEALRKVSSTVSHDNDFGLLFIAPDRLCSAEILRALGVCPSEVQCEFRFKDLAGKDISRTLKAEDPRSVNLVPFPRDQVPLYDQNQDRKFWFKVLPGSKMYMRLREVGDETAETFDAFCGRMFDEIDKEGLDKLIVDVRDNFGGDNTLNGALISRIIQHPAIDRRGHLFVIFGRATFSAAMSLVGNLERDTNPVFVGEPTGTSPNHEGEPARIVLPRSHLFATAATFYWMNTYAQDQRVWIAPELPAQITWDDFAKGIDPALLTINRSLG